MVSHFTLPGRAQVAVFKLRWCSSGAQEMLLPGLNAARGASVRAHARRVSRAGTLERFMKQHLATRCGVSEVHPRSLI